MVSSIPPPPEGGGGLFRKNASAEETHPPQRRGDSYEKIIIITNQSSGRYLNRDGNYAGTIRGTLEGIGAENIQWLVSNLGNGYFTIQNPLTMQALCCENGNIMLKLMPETIPNKFQWMITSGDGRVQNKLAKSQTVDLERFYLTDAGVITSVHTNVVATDRIDTQVQSWSFHSVEDYKEANSSIVFSDMTMDIGQRVLPTVVNPQGCTLAKATDFYYSGIENNGVVSFTPNTSRITGVNSGTALISAIHKTTGTSYSFNVKVNKNAIIIVPGIMGSQLYAGEDITVPSSWENWTEDTIPQGTLLWEPASGVMDSGPANEKILALRMNDDGTSENNVVVDDPVVNNITYTVSGDCQYGALNIYEDLYINLYNEFYDSNTDIILYQYDWRYDPYDAAQLLDEYITENSYGNIVFVAHSMGGIVTSYYLSLGVVQRQKVDKHISIGTPYLGAEKMATVMFTGKALGFWENLAIENYIKEIIGNIPSIYCLLPMEYLFSPYVKQSTSHGCAGEEIIPYTTYIDTMDFFQQYMPNWNEDIKDSVVNNHNRLWINNQHITTQVDSFYIVGDGNETVESLDFILMESLTQSPAVVSCQSNVSTNGDGTVQLHSATIADGAISNRVFYRYENEANNIKADHVEMINGDDAKCLNLIKAIIGNEISSVTAEQLEELYGAYLTEQ